VSSCLKEVQEKMEINKFVLRKLKGGTVVKIPRSFTYAECKCGAKDIVWVFTSKNNKKMPIRWSHEHRNWISHFVDCSLSEKFRRKK